VQKAIATGRIKTTADGKVDPDAANVAWESNTDESKLRRPVAIAPLASPWAPPSVPDSLGRTAPRQNGAVSGFQAAHAMFETYRARTARMNFERDQGRLLDAGEVQRAVFEINRTVRDRILGIPARVSSIVAAINVPAEVDKVLMNELLQALEELSRLEGKWKW
jgi:hypothetical protein